jgi:hypothetical protein
MFHLWIPSTVSVTYAITSLHPVDPFTRQIPESCSLLLSPGDHVVKPTSRNAELNYVAVSCTLSVDWSWLICVLD